MEPKFTVVAVSGGFDPVHRGHIDMFREARALGDKLIVFLNSDKFLEKKKGRAFMTFDERKEILEAIRYIDEVIPVIDTDQTVCKTIEKYKPDIFANGGDRNKDNVPEVHVCMRNRIKMYWNVGNKGKIQSSSWLLNNYIR